MGSKARRFPVEACLRYSFRDKELLHQALVHRSYAHEAGLKTHNEPLEFLGDAVLNFLVAERIMRRRPELDEGEMTRLRASMVNARHLAREAVELGLDRALRLGRGEENSGGRTKASLLADAMEAVIGAVFLDGGIRPARSLILRRFGPLIEKAPAQGAKNTDPKTRLQETAQANGWELPVYRLVEEHGPDHAREFVVEVLLKGECRGRGQGSSKKQAEQIAAAAALAGLAVEN